MAGRRESSRMGSSSHVFLAAMLNTWTTQLHFKECSTIGFFSYWHTKLQITSLHTERAATTGRAVQETWGFWWCRELLSKTIIKTWLELAKLPAKHLHFVDYPFLAASKLAAGYACFCVLTPSANFPNGNLQPELCQLSAAWPNLHHFTARNSILFHDRTNLKLWKKIIWNHLKMATHCHFS